MDKGSLVGSQGLYSRDGGASLERLWYALPWKEIRNCPGRFTTCDVAARTATPEQLLSWSGVDAVPSTTCQPIGKDLITVHRVHGGGGLLTYHKQDGIHVHTLNTESGLARKLDALGVAVGLVLCRDDSWGDCSALCCCVAILPFLVDREKNAAAYLLIVHLRRLAVMMGSEPHPLHIGVEGTGHPQKDAHTRLIDQNVCSHISLPSETTGPLPLCQQIQLSGPLESVTNTVCGHFARRMLDRRHSSCYSNIGRS